MASTITIILIILVLALLAVLKILDVKLSGYYTILKEQESNTQKYSRLYHVFGVVCISALYAVFLFFLYP